MVSKSLLARFTMTLNGRNAPRIYLAGPMADASHEEMNRWRVFAAAELLAVGFGVFDPVSRIGTPPNQIVDEDLAEIAASCGLLAWVSHKHRSVGTNMEIFWAGRILRKPVVLFGDIHPASPWHIEHRIASYGTLPAALNFIASNKTIFLAHAT